MSTQRKGDNGRSRTRHSTSENGPPPLSHPYHSFAVPPLGNSKLDGRSTSVTSYMSDLSMDESMKTHESLLEYSDTSGDEREDSYFLGEATTGRIRSILGRESDSSGESAFRDLKMEGSKSSHIVEYSSEAAARVSHDPTINEDSAPDHSSDQKTNDDEHDKKDSLKSWMTNLAYSFRSPRPQGAPQQIPTNNGSSKHKQQPSWGITEYPHTPILPWRDSMERHLFSYSGASGDAERTPLVPLGRNANRPYGSDGKKFRDQFQRGTGEYPDGKPRHTVLRSRTTAATIAACFLMDYEAGRPPTLSSNFDVITTWQLRLYQIHFSWPWRLFGIALPTFALFLAHSQSPVVTALMHTYAIVFLCAEVWTKEVLYAVDISNDNYHSERRLVKPMALFLVALGLESWIWCVFPPAPVSKAPSLVSSIFKPIVFFYISMKARNAVEALTRIGRVVTRVIMIEMFLILAFASVACQLFHNWENFKDLSSSWLSLFELSTTVVNPSLWMPMYEKARSNAVFFVVFVIVSVFYLHSLVLSVVFQTYVHAASEIHERSVMDREEAVRRAFLALLREESSDFISASSVRRTLQVVRPHYNAMKIKALMDMLDPSDQHAIDYPTFRTKIRQALNASIRTARSNTNFAMLVELIAVMVAGLNFLYVILLTSTFTADWFNSIIVSGGCTITLLGMFELAVRFNPTRISNFTPITRLNPTFDGLALVGGLVSCYGILKHIAGTEGSIDFLLMGRAIDTIRMMRFFPMFRDVVRRSSDVIPALAGPVFCVLTVVHVFVLLGMVLWGGAIDTEVLATKTDITPLYYLNNFNSYMEGMVTMFNILVVNDWHAIANVFVYADRCSHPYIVYPYFIAAICAAVFIMLNVITAFFVESFVTKIDDRPNEYQETDNHTVKRDFSIKTGENTNVKQIAQSSTRGLKELSEPADDEPFTESDDVSAHSTTSTLFAFDVYEREGFDQIMRNIASGVPTEAEESFARSICDYFEIFENLAPGREKIGYMICCQHSLNRFGNRRFQNISKDYLKANVLHKVVSDMHSELLVLSSRKKFEDRCLVRNFSHKTDPSLRLEITATLLRHQPAISLLVSRIRPQGGNDA